MSELVRAWRLLPLLIAFACASGSAIPPTVSSHAIPGSFTLATMTGEEDFVIPVTVNGVGPLPFLLDTGATTSAVYPQAMRAGGLLPSPDANVLVRGLTKAEKAPLVEVAQIGLGPTVKHDLLLPALPAPSFGRIAGIIGLDILKDYALVWNAEVHAMTFIPAAAFDASLFDGWDEVPLEERPFGGPAYGIVFGNAALGGRDVPVLIDTGTAPSVVNWEAASFSRSVRQLRARLQNQWEVEGAAGRFSPKALASLPTFQVGEHQWRSPQLLILDLAPLDVLGAEGKPLMIAGADMLSSRSFALDFKGKMLRFGPELRSGLTREEIAPRGIAAEMLSGD